MEPSVGIIASVSPILPEESKAQEVFMRMNVMERDR